MHFKKDDEVGNAFIETLGHELFVASDSYNAFLIYAGRLKVSRNRFGEVACYQAYANFLKSLYEYYKGVFKWKRGDSRYLDKDTDALDEAYNDAAQVLINFYRPVESSMNLKYPDKVPPSFGRDFSTIRNRMSHADHRRMKTGSDEASITLVNFYRNYNFYVYKMLHHPQFSWGIKSYETMYSWQEIGEFADILLLELI